MNDKYKESVRQSPPLMGNEQKNWRVWVGLRWKTEKDISNFTDFTDFTGFRKSIYV